MDDLTKRRIPQGECAGCERPYSEYSIHQCPARDWQCNVCDKYGHLDGFCEWYSGGAISFNSPLEETAHQYGPLIMEEGVRNCSGCDRPYTQEHHSCPARCWQCNTCYKYGHLDGLCEVYCNEAISFDCPLRESACRYGPDEMKRLLRDCRGCRRPYTELHVCPARDWQCGYCDKYGHLDGLCDVFFDEEISFDLPLKRFAYPYEPVKFEEFSEAMDREASYEVAHEVASLQEVKQEQHVNPGTCMCNAIKRSAEHSKLYDTFPGQKRPRCTDPAKQELNFFINRVEALKKENQALRQKLESAKNTNNGMLSKNGRKKSNAKKTNSYKNSSTKTVDELTVELEQTKAEKTKLKSQRDQLFEYSQELDAHSRKVATRVDHLTSDHRYIINRAYPDWPTATLPPWRKGRCMRCGSYKRHEEFDCYAKGHVCLQCDKFNHFAAVCRSAPSYKSTASLKQLNLIAEVRADIAASK